MKKSQIIILFFFLMFSFIAIFTKGFGFLGTNSTNSQNADDFIKIQLSEITDKAKWYEYDIGGSKIKIFAVKTSDGAVRTAFDVCDVCYYAKKGYRQEGNFMVCNNCGNRYPISSLGTENKTPGGCWPGYLSNTVKGDNVLIEKADLENNRWRSL